MVKSIAQLQKENLEMTKQIKKNTLEIIRLDSLYRMNLTEADIVENPKTICSVCQTPSTDGTGYCQTCGNEIK